MKTTDEQMLELCDEFKKFVSKYTKEHGIEPNEGIDYLDRAFKEWLFLKDWQTRNDSAWELAKAAVKRYGFANK